MASKFIQIQPIAHGSDMLNLAAENGKLLRVPKIRKPPDGKPRQGFLELDQCAAVARYLAPHLQVATAIGYTLATFWCRNERARPVFLRGAGRETRPNAEKFVGDRDAHARW
jgi:hypothetical protein